MFLVTLTSFTVCCSHPDNSVANHSIKKDSEFFSFHREIIMGRSWPVKWDKRVVKTVEKFSKSSFQIFITWIDHHYLENCNTPFCHFLYTIWGTCIDFSWTFERITWKYRSKSSRIDHNVSTCFWVVCYSS